MLIEWQRVPRTSAIGLAAVAHLFLIFLFLPARQTGSVHLVSQELQNVPIISKKTHLIYRGMTAEMPAPRKMAPHRSTRTPVVPAESDAQSAALNGLREQASKGAKALTRALWFRQIYGFYPGHDYQLAFRTSGEVHISADELPPRFEQFVVVEVTIDTDGHVADARRLSGMVPPAVEQKLLSEIRRFKYHPATRDGLAIPTQLDVVIHVPS
jgi:TonB family protein